LELHYNNFNGYDLESFVNKLSSNNVLKILDLSWNRLGASETCINKLSESLKLNKSITHLDLSHNNIKYNESLIEFIKSNHSIIGLHILGNDIEIDSNG